MGKEKETESFSELVILNFWIELLFEFLNRTFSLTFE